LPGWLARAADDWQPGIVGFRLPKPSELRAGINTLHQLAAQPVTVGFAKQCLAKLMVAFEPNTKLSAEDTRMRAAVWLEVNGDLRDELWADATNEAIRNLKWMPKPAEFRELVADRLRKDADRLHKLERMLGEAERHDPKKPFEPEPFDVRLRAMRDSFRKIGNITKAANYEIQLAAHEKRVPEEWATWPQKAEAPVEKSAAPVVAKRELPPEIQAELYRSQAALLRRQGHTKMAAATERLAEIQRLGQEIDA